MPWLMKAEPDSRIVKGKDVKFSVDDFEEMGTSPWDGVRNHEAKKIMKEKMKVGDRVLFYHSNCNTPGVFAEAEIAKEGYPDYTAWDPSHPYFDPKTKQDNPTWYMVDVKFTRRLPHPPTLSLIKVLAALPPSALPDEISYIGQDGLKAIAGMQLVNRGRLSVQPVEEAAYEAICQLGTKGGFEPLLSPSASSSSVKAKADPTPKRAPSTATTNKRSRAAKADVQPDADTGTGSTSSSSAAFAFATNRAAKSLPSDSNDVSASIARENSIHPSHANGTNMTKSKSQSKRKLDSDSDLSPPPLLKDDDEGKTASMVKTKEPLSHSGTSMVNGHTGASSGKETGSNQRGERRSKRIKN
ncbi:hypothetical protein IAU59_002431 [Kwoniella sp. CBS 9459]